MSNYKAYLKGLYGNNTSYDVIKNNDYKIELLEACNIKTKEELYTRERYFIKNKKNKRDIVICIISNFINFGLV